MGRSAHWILGELKTDPLVYIYQGMDGGRILPPSQNYSRSGVVWDVSVMLILVEMNFVMGVDRIYTSGLKIEVSFGRFYF